MECLESSLNYLHVEELRAICEKLSLSNKGKKLQLIHKILRFLETGERLDIISFPKESLAKRGEIYVIAPDALMLKNSYKNDLKTRNFFKSLIGDYFHFTVFGIDWLNEKWMEGKPPTYNDFAQMWKQEYQRRKEYPGSPKQEWAYINFVQKYYLNSPNAERDEVLNAWNKERKRHKSLVEKFLAKL